MSVREKTWKIWSRRAAHVNEKHILTLYYVAPWRADFANTSAWEAKQGCLVVGYEFFVLRIPAGDVRGRNTWKVWSRRAAQVHEKNVLTLNFVLPM